MKWSRSLPKLLFSLTLAAASVSLCIEVLTCYKKCPKCPDDSMFSKYVKFYSNDLFQPKFHSEPRNVSKHSLPFFTQVPTNPLITHEPVPKRSSQSKPAHLDASGDRKPALAWYFSLLLQALAFSSGVPFEHIIVISKSFVYIIIYFVLLYTLIYSMSLSVFLLVVKLQLFSRLKPDLLERCPS